MLRESSRHRMIVNHVLFAQAARFIHVKSPIYVPDLVKAVQAEYGIVRIPPTPEEVLLPADGSRAMVFNNGKVIRDGREVVIDALNLYPQAIGVDTRTSTDDSDFVIEDILARGAGLVAAAEGPRVYISQLEV